MTSLRREIVFIKELRSKYEPLGVRSLYVKGSMSPTLKDNYSVGRYYQWRHHQKGEGFLVVLSDQNLVYEVRIPFPGDHYRIIKKTIIYHICEDYITTGEWEVPSWYQVCNQIESLILMHLYSQRSKIGR